MCTLYFNLSQKCHSTQLKYNCKDIFVIKNMRLTKNRNGKIVRFTVFRLRRTRTFFRTARVLRSDISEARLRVMERAPFAATEKEHWHFWTFYVPENARRGDHGFFLAKIT